MRKNTSIILAALTMICCSPASKEHQTKGIVCDATMNTISIVTANKDTLSFSTLDADKSHVTGLLLNDTAEILDIAVKPEYRKHGIGKSLIDFIFTQFPIDNITAETDDEAVEFYKRCGFNVIGFGMKCNNKRYICNKLKF